MSNFKDKSVTLIELIIAVTLVAAIILGINGINIFSHSQIISSDRRTKIQNDISFCLDHISKTAVETIGNEVVFGLDTAVKKVTDTSLAFFIDANANGNKDSSGDYWVKYTFSSSDNKLTYCGNCGSSSACGTCSISNEVLSSKIVAFTPAKDFTLGNHVGVEITGRWLPSESASSNNPEVKMNSAIQLPSVSTN